LYGLDRAQDARRARYVVIVEGESDAQTLWFHHVPAVGLPGVATWKAGWASHFGAIPVIYVFLEPDRGGDAMAEWVGRCHEIRERVRFVKVPGVKDPSELHCQGPDEFRAAWEAAIRSAVPWVEDNRELGGSNLPTTRDPIRPTDTGNGERFAEQHRGKARYCVERNDWLVWDGMRWRVDNAEARRLAKQTKMSSSIEYGNCFSRSELLKIPDGLDEFLKSEADRHARERPQILTFVVEDAEVVECAIEQARVRRGIGTRGKALVLIAQAYLGEVGDES